MALLHATPLYVGSIGSGSYVTAYTVPTGYRVILREIVAYNTTGTATVVLSAIDGTAFDNTTLAVSGAAGSSFTHNYWIVLGPGQTIQFATGGSRTVDFVVSGSIYTI